MAPLMNFISTTLALALFAMLLGACGNADKEFCQKQNDRLATFESRAKRQCSVETSFQTGAATVNACEKTVRAQCNDADKAATEAFLLCIEPLDVCETISLDYESCYNQHASRVRTACLNLLFGTRG